MSKPISLAQEIEEAQIILREDLMEAAERVTDTGQVNYAYEELMEKIRKILSILTSYHRLKHE